MALPLRWENPQIPFVKSLITLQGAGYLEKVKVDNKVEYKANIKHPLFDVMQKVVFKHLGLRRCS
jgi:hypothetical protein